MAFVLDSFFSLLFGLGNFYFICCANGNELDVGHLRDSLSRTHLFMTIYCGYVVTLNMGQMNWYLRYHCVWVVIYVI